MQTCQPAGWETQSVNCQYFMSSHALRESIVLNADNQSFKYYKYICLN